MELFWDSTVIILFLVYSLQYFKVVSMYILKESQYINVYLRLHSFPRFVKSIKKFCERNQDVHYFPAWERNMKEKDKLIIMSNLGMHLLNQELIKTWVYVNFSKGHAEIFY